MENGLPHPISSHEKPRDKLGGQVERIMYMNEETGFTVAKVVSTGHSSPVTIVGNLPALSPGEVLKMEGFWESHRRFGRQFRVLTHQTVLPATVKGIRKYLGSGLVKGIGPALASRIVNKFGEKTLTIIESRIEELGTVEGIGQKRLLMINEAWAAQKEIRGIMIFLQQYNVGLSHAARIYKKYGQRSIAVVSQNPYRLATDIAGIGFRTADRIAEKLGFKKNAPVRAEAGILHVLNQLSEEGHVFYPYERLLEKCQRILEVDAETLLKAFAQVSLDGGVVIEDLNERLEKSETNRKAVYLSRFHVSETGIARHFSRLLSTVKSTRRMDAEKAIRWVQKRIKLGLAPGQMDAIRHAISDKALIITGGPGTGKTTVIHAVIEIYAVIGAAISLAAPTGRAAKRMTEATGRAAKTIHRMLEYSWQKGGFTRDENRPLETDVIILDEVSMIDTLLMYHFLKAVPAAASLILVGDSNQLPSVGPGNVLGDLIKSGVIPVIELNQIFRQARKSRIVVNAHRINRGRLPELQRPRKNLEDFYFIEQDEPDRALKTIIDLVSRRIPRRFKMDPIEDIQVLSPMHKGEVGTENLNKKLQDALNHSSAELVRGERRFRLKDKVMQIRNNYEKEVFNGDIGRIESIDAEKQSVVIAYEGRQVPYDFSELDEIVLAYAISVHKSQGSEYPGVVIPLLPQHYLLLQRNLIYTAVTRGKRLVVITGSKKALATGVMNATTLKRHTFLAQRLRGTDPEAAG
jgi:exodeoxyribonuclease V alpha subunit